MVNEGRCVLSTSKHNMRMIKIKKSLNWFYDRRWIWTQFGQNAKTDLINECLIPKVLHLIFYMMIYKLSSHSYQTRSLIIYICIIFIQTWSTLMNSFTGLCSSLIWSVRFQQFWLTSSTDTKWENIGDQFPANSEPGQNLNKTMSGPDSTDVDMANIYFTYKTSNEARLGIIRFKSWCQKSKRVLNMDIALLESSDGEAEGGAALECRGGCEERQKGLKHPLSLHGQ